MNNAITLKGKIAEGLKPPAGNFSEDIVKVRAILEKIPPASGGQVKPPPNAEVAPVSIFKAISFFQSKNGLPQSGQLSPGGSTLAKLNSVATQFGCSVSAQKFGVDIFAEIFGGKYGERLVSGPGYPLLNAASVAAFETELKAKGYSRSLFHSQWIGGASNEQTQPILDWINQYPAGENDRLFIVGVSSGGTVARKVANKLPENRKLNYLALHDAAIPPLTKTTPVIDAFTTFVASFLLTKTPGYCVNTYQTLSNAASLPVGMELHGPLGPASSVFNTNYDTDSRFKSAVLPALVAKPLGAIPLMGTALVAFISTCHVTATQLGYKDHLPRLKKELLS